MKVLKRSLLFFIVSVITACTSSTPTVVSELDNLQIPVTQSAASDSKVDTVKIETIYKDNEKVINELSLFLKKTLPERFAYERCFRHPEFLSQNLYITN